MPGRVYPTNPAQWRESEPREQRWVLPSPVELVFAGHSSCCTVATAPDTAHLVDSSAFAAPLVGLTALRNPTLIPCFHPSRSGLEDNEPIEFRSQSLGGGLTEKLTVLSIGNILAFSLTLWRLRWASEVRLGSQGVSFPR